MRIVTDLNSYETVVIIKPDLNEDQEKTLVSKVTDLIKQFSGDIKKNESWGKKRLAYEIKKQSRGNYCYWLYKAKPAVVAELERTLRINDNVLRFLTIKLTEKELEVCMQTQVVAKEATI